jgi:hypothetical protein
MVHRFAHAKTKFLLCFTQRHATVAFEGVQEQLNKSFIWELNGGVYVLILRFWIITSVRNGMHNTNACRTGHVCPSACFLHRMAKRVFILPDIKEFYEKLSSHFNLSLEQTISMASLNTDLHAFIQARVSKSLFCACIFPITLSSYRKFGTSLTKSSKTKCEGNFFLI